MTRWHKAQEARILFLTGNVNRRLPLFKEANLCKLALESLNHCRSKHKLEVYAFVLMPDHFHLLLGVREGQTLAAFLRDWKGYTGHRIVDWLTEKRRIELLKRLQVDSKRRKDSRFRVFQPDTHVEGIISRKFLLQKLHYIHNNPVEAGLAGRTVDYPYSSARNWFLEDHSLFRTDAVGL